MDEVSAIADLIRDINDAWLSGNVAQLNQYFHEDMVIRGPEFQELCRGKAACVKSYEEFLSQATVKDYKDAPASIDLFGSTAVATFQWEMRYELSGKEYNEPGSDTLVLTKQNDEWLVSWRLVLVNPKK
jgi:ketosteroid isomerase-like protein